MIRSLLNRTLRVKINMTTSNTFNASSGVPQGTHFRSILVILDINGLTTPVFRKIYYNLPKISYYFENNIIY